MLHAKFNFPLWLCRDVDYSRTGVLLCVDDSEAFRRMADHVGFILQGETRHAITLLRVMKKEGEQPEGVFSDAIRILEDSGFPSRLIRTRLEIADDVPGAILREANRGCYAAVAVGRTGMKKNGALSRLFATSVTVALFRKLTGAALFVSR
jgi:hypothetical protein